VIRFCANIGFLFTELAYPDRFAAARRAGFEAVEFAWPPLPREDLLAAVADAGVEVAQMNMDAGDLAAGERGWASHPHAVERWRSAFESALELAEALRCPRINVLAGNAPVGVAREELLDCLRDNLRGRCHGRPPHGVLCCSKCSTRATRRPTCSPTPRPPRT
jgi:hydroxypyruvate isomerase